MGKVEEHHGQVSITRKEMTFNLINKTILLNTSYKKHDNNLK